MAEPKILGIFVAIVVIVAIAEYSILQSTMVRVETTTVISLETKTEKTTLTKTETATSVVTTATIVRETITRTSIKTITETITVQGEVPSTTHYIEIQDAILFIIHYNETYASVYLQIKIKNVRDYTVVLNNLTVDNITPVEVNHIVNVSLRPGETYSTSMFVRSVDPSVDTEWEAGTEHLITVYYTVLATGETHSIWIKVIMR